MVQIERRNKLDRMSGLDLFLDYLVEVWHLKVLERVLSVVCLSGSGSLYFHFWNVRDIIADDVRLLVAIRWQMWVRTPEQKLLNYDCCWKNHDSPPATDVIFVVVHDFTGRFISSWVDEAQEHIEVQFYNCNQEGFSLLLMSIKCFRVNCREIWNFEWANLQKCVKPKIRQMEQISDALLLWLFIVCVVVDNACVCGGLR